MRWIAGEARGETEDKARCACLMSLCAVVLPPAVEAVRSTAALSAWDAGHLPSGIKSVGLARARKKLLGRRPGQGG